MLNFRKLLTGFTQQHFHVILQDRFMRKKHLPKSLRKFIRREKARINRQVFDLKEQKKLVRNIHKNLKVSRNKTG